MKAKLFLLLFFAGISVALNSQPDTAPATPGDEEHYTIYIARCMSWQEYNNGTYKTAVMVYINDQPVGELDCQHRISVKAFSEGNLRLTVKWVPDKIYTEKKIGKHLHIGNPLDLEVKHGGNYYLHLALNENTHVGKINLTAYLVNYPESESIFKDEPRYKKYPEIKGFAEDPNNPYIKKSE